MPRPTIEGSIIRQIDMRCTANGSHKDYRITITQDPRTLGCRVYTEYGPAGFLRQGKELPGAPFSPDSANHTADVICSRKRSQRDSYTVLSDKTFPTPGIPSPAPAPAPRQRLSVDTLSAASRDKLARSEEH